MVVTSTGAPVSIGRFYIVDDALLNGAQRVELAFETEAMACRLRIPQAKVDTIKETWDGMAFKYELPAGDRVWRGAIPQSLMEDAPPIIETFPLPTPRNDGPKA